MIACIVLILSLLYALFISWCIVGWLKIKPWKSSIQNANVTISVVIPARNEEENIAACLEDLFLQDYPANLFEVIVADDHSEDRTPDLVRSFMSQHPGINLRLLQSSEDPASRLYKKDCITRAIDIASNELIVTTDADCRRGRGWLKTIAGYYSANRPMMICGPVMYAEERSLLEMAQSLEFVGLVAIGAGSAGNGSPLLCNGANLCFTKAVFRETGGYASEMNLATGDDTLLMRKIRRTYRVGVQFLKSEEAVVTTRALRTVSAFFNQRKRWASKIPREMGFTTLWIGVVAYLLHAGIILVAATSFWFDEFDILILTLIFKMLPEFILLSLAASYFKKSSLLVLFLPLQVIYPLYIAIVGPLSLAGNYEWKGRKIK